MSSYLHRDVELWLLAKLVDVCTEAAGGRPPAYVIYDKAIFSLKKFLDYQRVGRHPLENYHFTPSRSGPYLVNPPLYTVVAWLEANRLVKTVLEVRPFEEELLETEELDPDEYADLVKRYARDVDLYKRSIAYFIVPIRESIERLEAKVRQGLPDKELQVYDRGLGFVYSHFRAIYCRYGILDAMHIVRLLHDIYDRQ